jgi:SulP family sulfate permease
VLTIVTLLALTRLFEDLPVATLAAIVVAAVVDLIDVPALLSLYRAYSRRLGRQFGLVARPDFIAAMAALLGVLIFDPLPGLFIGITVSLLLLVYRASRPYVATLGKTAGPDGQYRDLDRHPDARTPEHIAVLRAESGLYFANAYSVRTRILQAATPEHIRAVVLDAETTPFVDVTSARMLADRTEELHARGVQLMIAREIGQVRDVLRHVVDDRVLTNVYPTVQAAVDAAGVRGRESRSSRH